MISFPRPRAKWIASILGGALLSGSLAIAQPADADHSPEVEKASFRIAPGFEVNLFASEKDGVIKPIQIRFDAAGKLWVIGSSVYPQIQPGQKPDDKILVLEDTNADGLCDKTTVFADGLMIPTGIEVGDGGVYLGHGTELLFLRDTDGDGKADERRVVMRGFGTGDNHQNINSFLWGPGGELWMSQGLHTYSNVETPYGIVRNHQAGIWRFRPQTGKLEPFYGSAYEPQNPWGFLFTDWGEPIVLAGNNSSPIYPVPGLVANRKAAPPALIHRNGRGRKVSGGDIVGTKHFPDDWQGLVITGGYINNSVWALKLSDDGSGFVLQDMPPLIQSTNRNFRPVDVKFAPDGSLYICDWYNPIIGHYQESFRHPNRDKAHGRIWRVTATGRPLTPNLQLDKKSAAELLALLDSNDRWTRQFTKRALANLSAVDVEKELNAIATKENLRDLHLKELLGVSQIIGKVSIPLLERLAKANDASARAYAAYVLGLWADRLPGGLAQLSTLAGDENARVRLHAIVAATYYRSARAMEAAARAADFPSDKFLDYAFNQVVHSLKPQWLPAFQQGALNLGNKPARIAMLIRADATADVLQAVRAALKSPELAAGGRETYLLALAEHGELTDFLEILKLPNSASKPKALQTMATAVRVRNLKSTEELNRAVQTIIQSNDSSARTAVYQLAGAWKLSAAIPALQSAASSASIPIPERRAALEAIGLSGNEEARPFLTSIALSSSARKNEDPITSAAVAALAKVDVQASAELAARVLATIKTSEAIKEIFTEFLSRENGAKFLQGALAVKPPSAEQAEIALQIMNSTGRRNAPLASFLETAAGLKPMLSQMNEAEVVKFAREVKETGNSKRGFAIYNRAELGCVSCHQVNGTGGKIGSDLSSLGSAQPIDFIVRAILDPQKEIKEGFTSISITTKDGESLQGYLARENKDEVVIRDTLQNAEVRIRRDAIKEMKPAGSLMPTGLADGLSREEFRDLVHYLSELGTNK